MNLALTLLIRQAVPGNAVLRRQANGLASAERRLSFECEMHPAFDAADGPDADLPEANSILPVKGQ